MSATIHPAFTQGKRVPNLWDAAAILCVFAVLIGVVEVARGTFATISAPGAVEVSLDPKHLPEYAVRTTLRMFAALVASLLFTFTYGTAAAKSRRAGLVLIPILDILQSVPILGFLTFTVVFFMSQFPGKVLGLELAAIFAIFTSQAWNMAFSMYQSLHVLFIVHFGLNADIWLTPLMILGTQWYILFNVVARAAAFPGDLREAATNFRVGGSLWWSKVMIPGISPYYVTGAITASCGSWNAAIVAEVASWGDTKLTGLWCKCGGGSAMLVAP
jgi:ABC-type anion transport system duplicated permease subunit